MSRNENGGHAPGAGRSFRKAGGGTPPRVGRALVTGASSGIGEAIARDLAGRGWALVVTARSEDRLRELASEFESHHGVEVRVIPGDLTEPEMPARLEEATEGAGIEIDLLVNNAGFGYFGPFLESSVESDRAMIEVNLLALTELTRRFARPMVARGRGRILNVASTAAFQPGPLMAVYYATKAFVLSLGEALREELKDSGVTVTTLCPGPTRSGFHHRAGTGDSPLFKLRTGPTSADVARFGVKAALAGRGIAVHGFVNRLLAVGVRLTPRRWLPGLVRRVQEERG